MESEDPTMKLYDNLKSRRTVENSGISTMESAGTASEFRDF